MSELKDQDPDYGPSITNTEKQQRLYEENARISTARKITAIIEKEFSHEIASKEKEIFEIQNRLQRALKTLHLLRYVIVTDFYNKKQCKLQTESRQTQPHPAIKSLIGKSPKTHFPTTTTDSERNFATGSEASSAFETAAGTCEKPCLLSCKGTQQKTELLCLDGGQPEDPSSLETAENINFQEKNPPAEFSNSELHGNCSRSKSLRIEMEEKCLYNLSLEKNNIVNGSRAKSMERKADYGKFERNNSREFENLSEKNSKDSNNFQTSEKKFGEKVGHLVEPTDPNFINFDTLSSNSSENFNSNCFDNIRENHSRVNNIEEPKNNGTQRRLSSNNFRANLVDTNLSEVAINDANSSKGAPKKIPRYIPPKSTSPSSSPSRLRQKVRKRLIIGNISKWIPPDYREDNSTHKWTIYVQGNRENRNIDYISKVRFFLHPSYRPNDVIEVSNYPFCISRRGWGEFPIRIQLHFKNLLNKPVDVIHCLKLDKSYTGLQTLGSETVVDVWIYEENDKVKRKAICMEKDSEEAPENTNTETGRKRKRTDGNPGSVNEEEGSIKNENLKNLYENGQQQQLNIRKEEEFAEDAARSSDQFRRSSIGTSERLCKGNSAQENREKVKKCIENLVGAVEEKGRRPTTAHRYPGFEDKAAAKSAKSNETEASKEKGSSTPETDNTGCKDHVDLMPCDLRESEAAVSERTANESREKEGSMNEQFSMFGKCTANLRDEVGLLLERERTLQEKEQAEDALRRIRSVISLDHDYLGSMLSATEGHLEKFLEIEKASLQSTVNDRMIKLDSKLQPLKISIPSPFESSSKRVLVLQNDKTIPVEITSRPKIKFAGRSLLKRNSNNINEIASSQANNQEDKKNSGILQMNSKSVIFDVNSSVPTLKIANVFTRNGIETKNSPIDDNEGVVTRDEGRCGKDVGPENEIQEPSMVRQEVRTTSFNPLNDVPSVKPKLTIGKDKYKLQNKREFYSETLALIDSIQLFEIPSFLRFVMARLPLITENASDPEYKRLHPYSCTSETEYVGFSVAKQRAMEWQRAKFAREFLKKRKTDEDLWSIKEILMWARFHGYTPIHTHSTQESSKGNHSCFSSVTEPQEFIKWKESNPMNSTDPDIDSSIDILHMESDKEKDENKERKLEILGMDKKLEPLYEFVSTTTREIGLKLQPEEIVPNVAYCAAARLIMRAVECLVDDLLRSSLAKAWERHDYSGCPNVIRLDDVRHAIRNRDEFSLFTNSGLGSIYQPPKD